MSNDVTPEAYKTRLGNLPAKSVLALLADVSSDDGYGWPTVERIAWKTEIQKRTVMRVIQVFVEIGLVTKVDRGRNEQGKRKNFGIQLAMEKLGTDLRAEFAEAYRAVQRKGVSFTQCLSDTGESVSETQNSVSETLPPHPHKGGTVREPSGNKPCIPKKSNAAQPEAAKAISAAVEAAVDQVMQDCGFSKRRLRRPIREQVELEWDIGEPPQTTALRMIAAWREYCAAGSLLAARWGPANFFGEGHWRRPESWMWSGDRMREASLQAQARVGVAR